MENTAQQLADRPAYEAATATVRTASEAYYRDGSSHLTDADYDGLLEAIAAAEAAHPEWVTGTPLSEQVAAGAAPTGDVAHEVTMLSLEKVAAHEDLARFLDNAGVTDWTVEPKLDGAALSLEYREGALVQASTRGDGARGEDVTYAVPAITTLPAGEVRLPGGALFTGIVRGEAIFTTAQFAAANEARAANGDETFAKARNGLVGTMRGAATRAYAIPFSFFAYEVADAATLDNPEFGKIAEHTNAMAVLESMGFATTASLSPAGIVQTTETVPAAVDSIEDAALDVEIDGAVIKADSYRARARLGVGTRAPRWARAFKYADEVKRSVLREVTWETGRTGVIAPRARFDAVELDGSNVIYATLHNPGDITRRGLMLGDTIEVTLAKKIIPRVVGPVVEDRDGTQTEIVMPDSCPQCGSAIDTSGGRWKCTGARSCNPLPALTYAAGRDAWDLEGLGTAIATALVAEGTVADVADLLTLDAATIAALPVLNEDGSVRVSAKGERKVGETVAAKIVEHIERAKTLPLAKHITALGIAGTGRGVSRRLAAHFGTLEAFATASTDQLANVEMIGDKKAELIRAELDALAPVIAKLAAVIAPAEQAPAEASGVEGAPLAGQKVVVTGSMSGALEGKSRTEVQDLIAALGGTPSGSVSKSTNLLVVGAKAGSKLEKAQSLGVRVLTEAEFAAEYLGQ